MEEGGKCGYKGRAQASCDDDANKSLRVSILTSSYQSL